MADDKKLKVALVLPAGVLEDSKQMIIKMGHLVAGAFDSVDEAIRQMGTATVDRVLTEYSVFDEKKFRQQFGSLWNINTKAMIVILLPKKDDTPPEVMRTILDLRQEFVWEGDDGRYSPTETRSRLDRPRDLATMQAMGVDVRAERPTVTAEEQGDDRGEAEASDGGRWSVLSGLAALVREVMPKPGPRPPTESRQSRDIPQRGGGTRFVAHRSILVWGSRRTSTVVNIAVAAARLNFDAVGINLDWEWPILDRWIGDPEDNPGPMSMAQEMDPRFALRMLVSRWDARWLPAGKRMDNSGAPDLLETMGKQRAQAMLEDTITVVYRRPTGTRPALTVMDAGRSFAELATLAGLEQASHVLLVSTGDTIADDELALQAGWLCRHKITSPDKLIFLSTQGTSRLDVRYKDVISGRKERVTLISAAELPEDLARYQMSTAKREPEALTPGPWDDVLRAVVFGGTAGGGVVAGVAD